MSKTVYMVIRHNPYEDSDIEGLYDNRELAELAAVIFEGSDIEEYEVNAHEDKIRSGIRGWSFSFLFNGDVHHCRLISGLVDDDRITDSMPDFFDASVPEPVLTNVMVMAKDEGEAREKASAKRAEFLKVLPYDLFKARNDAFNTFQPLNIHRNDPEAFEAAHEEYLRCQKEFADALATAWSNRK